MSALDRISSQRQLQLTAAILVSVVICLAAAAVWKHLRGRHLDRIAREHRDAIGDRVAEELKRDPEPPASGEEAVAFLASLHELAKSSSEGKR